MSYSNGLLPDQSYQTANKYVQRGLPSVGFKFTDTGDYDMQNKKLTNVKSGTDSNDAVNKSQLDATTNLLHGSRAGVNTSTLLSMIKLSYIVIQALYMLIVYILKIHPIKEIVMKFE